MVILMCGNTKLIGVLFWIWWVKSRLKSKKNVARFRIMGSGVPWDFIWEIFEKYKETNLTEPEIFSSLVANGQPNSNRLF